MTGVQTNQYNMGNRVLGDLDKFSSVWSGNAGAVAKRDLVAAILMRVQVADGKQQAASAGGERKGKIEKKRALASLARVLGSGVVAYAMDMHDHNARLEFGKTEWRIFQMKDIDCMTYCKLLRKFVSDHLGALRDYNIDNLALDALDAAIAAFKGVQVAPMMAKERLGTATKEVKQSLKELFAVLRWWDRFMGTLRVAQPNFYLSYRSARKVHRTGIRHVSIRGAVRAEGTGTLLYKVKVRVEGSKFHHHAGAEGSDWVKFVKRVKSGKTGLFRVRSLQPGVYTVVFELRGYETVSKEVAVKVGEISEVEVVMRAM